MCLFQGAENTRPTCHIGKLTTRRLGVKPKRAEGASAPSPPLPINNIENILKSVPVSSCRETTSGGIVVKFPNGDAKAHASALMGPLSESSGITVSEPKKMMPKMTLLDVPVSLPEDQIIQGIKDKNTKIRELFGYITFSQEAWQILP